MLVKTHGRSERLYGPHYQDPWLSHIREPGTGRRSYFSPGGRQFFFSTTLPTLLYKPHAHKLWGCADVISSPAITEVQNTWNFISTFIVLLQDTVCNCMSHFTSGRYRKISWTPWYSIKIIYIKYNNRKTDVLTAFSLTAARLPGKYRSSDD